MPMDKNTFLQRGLAFSKGIISSNHMETSTAPLETGVAPTSYFTSNSFPVVPRHTTFNEDVASLHSYNTETNVDNDQGALLIATKLMANIEKDRIPCPRLCGATFSCGVGGIASEYFLIWFFDQSTAVLYLANGVTHGNVV